MYGNVDARRRRENFGDILLPESDFLLFYGVFNTMSLLKFFETEIPKFATWAEAGNPDKIQWLFQMSKFNCFLIDFFRCQNSIIFWLNFSDPEWLNSIIFWLKKKRLIVTESSKKTRSAFGRVFNGNCFLIFKNRIFIDFQWKLFLFFIFFRKNHLFGKSMQIENVFSKKKLGAAKLL